MQVVFTGWHDLPGEDEDGNPCLFKYDEQAAIDLVANYPVLGEMIFNFLNDKKKVRSPFPESGNASKNLGKRASVAKFLTLRCGG